MRKVMIFGGFIFLMVSLSCSKSNDSPTVRSSQYGQDKSHNTGMNCMECHNSFTVSGTVYNIDLVTPFPNSTLYLLDAPDPQGDTLMTLEVDGKGNFYTNQEIDFSSPVYTSIWGNDTTIYKSFPVANGACNSCHNQNAPPIWTR